MRIPGSLLAALLALATASPAAAAVVISIDKDAQRMRVSVDGAERWDWKVSTGRRGYATPTGTFKPFRLEEDHFSKEWDDAPMPHSIFFTAKGHAIHGSFETRKLGRPASAGCVRLAPANAKQLFTLVKAKGLGNTRVVISGSEPLVAEKPQRRVRQAAHARQHDEIYGVYSDDRYWRGRGYSYAPGPYAAQPLEIRPRYYYRDGTPYW
jgi:hypothetical protein